MDLGTALNWKLSEHCCEGAGFMDVRRIVAMVVDDKNLVMNNCSSFERDRALGSWKI